jgi:hypothetical protein
VGIFDNVAQERVKDGRIVFIAELCIELFSQKLSDYHWFCVEQEKARDSRGRKRLVVNDDEES